jgi:hypothetical protein
LGLSVSVLREANAKGAAPSSRVLKGHTRDVSKRGLALLLPQVHLGGYHLAAEGRKLHVTLELPDGQISMIVLPRRYEMLDDSDLGCNYLLGATIIDVSDDDRARLENFLSRGLKGQSLSDSDSSED